MGELVQGTLDMPILKVLGRSAEHGFGIARRMRQVSEEVLSVEEGSLYPALHRLEVEGLIAAEWGISQNNRRTRFYALTSKGRKKLADERLRWNRLTAAIMRVMETS